MRGLVGECDGQQVKKILHDLPGWFQQETKKPNFLIKEGEEGFEQLYQDWLVSKPHTKNLILTFEKE